MYSTYIYIYIHSTGLCGTVTHNIGWGCHSPNPREVHPIKGNFVFDLRDVVQERNLA